MTAAQRPRGPFSAGRDHLLARIGLRMADDGGGRVLSLDPAPVLLAEDGHLSFGALGMLFDLASSTASTEGPRPFVHADITVHRLRPPTGPVLATAWFARAGKRTAVIHVDLHDRTRALVATSTQEVVFRDPPPGGDGGPRPGDVERIRAMFQEMFDGTCRLDRPLEDELGIVADSDGWRLSLADDRTNGFGGLHGGVATTLVDVASAGAVQRRWRRPARTVSAAVRYLSPATVGPFVARPEVLVDHAGLAVLRVPILDTGQDDRLVIVADVHVADPA